MKKIYSLLALFAMLFAAVGASAQQYSLDTQVELPEEGTQYALCNLAQGTYLSSKSGLISSLESNECLWTFEKSGNQVDGYDLYYMKSVESGGYWQEIDFENNLGLDGYDITGYGGENVAKQLGASKATAIEVTILVADGSSERSTGNATGGVIICRKNPVAQDASTTWYYKLETQSPTVSFSPWNGENVWTLWTVRENTNQEKLQILVDEILTADNSYTVGTDPGYYTQATVDEYNNALEDAQTALNESLTQEEYGQIYDKLKAIYTAMSDNVIPVTEGYYYIKSAYPEYFNQQGVEKAMYGANATTPKWADFDATNYAYLWKVEKYGEGWKIKNVLYDAYISGAASGQSAQVYMAESTDRTTFFRALGSGQWNIYDSGNQYAYHTNGHGSGAGKSGTIVTWNGGAGSGSSWAISTVSDQDFINAAIQAHSQIGIKTELNALIVEGGTVYDQLFTVSADLESPLVTEASDDVTINEEGNQFLCNRKETSEGRYAALIDGIVSTADNNGGNKDINDQWAYFHSAWAGAENVGTHSSDATDFLQVDLSKTPVSSFVLRTARRYNNANAQPIQIGIYATNDTTGFYNATDKWTKITTIYPKECAQEEYYTSPLIELGAEYKYIRFVMEKTNNERRYFTYSEFNLYKGSVSQELSQYYYAEGMKDAADAMKASITTASEAIAAGNATEDMITDLTNKIAAVKALYADPTELKSLISTATTELQYVTVGEDMGNISDQDVVDAYTNALATAQEFDLDGAVKKAELDKVTSDLNAARTAFYDAMVVPDSTKWYFITSTDESRDGESYTHGASIYAETVGTGASVRWGANESGELDGQALAMWRVIPVKDAETPHTVYIQNMGTGLYLGDESKNLSYVTHLSATPVAFTLTYVGNSSLAICLTEGNTNNTSLHAQVVGKSVVGWYYNVGGVDANGTPSNTASLWTFNEVEDLEGVTVPVTTGMTYVKVLPFPASDLTEYNENVKTYGIQNMETEDGTTTVSLYEKDEFAAGEPFIIEVDAADTTTVDLLIPAPTTKEIITAPKAGNGLVGVFGVTAVPAGKAYMNAADSTWTVSTGAEANAVAAQTGYIDLSKFTGAVDAEVAKSFTIVGLTKDDAVAGDVDGDGNINSTDVVAVYNYIIGGADSGISAESADVDGDGSVNSTDVVAVYNYIIGGSAKSGAFVKEVVSASTTISAADNDKAFITLQVGSTTDLTKVPVSVMLSNAAVEISGLECYIKAPVDVKNFLEEDEEVVYDSSDRWKKSHGLTAAKGTTSRPTELYVSIVSNKSKNFDGTEGDVLTVYVDCSSLSDGDYTMDLADAFAIWTDGKDITNYYSANSSAKFSISGGKATGIEGVEAESTVADGAIYTINGQQVAAPAKGQIYIVNGKKVKF